MNFRQSVRRILRYKIRTTYLNAFAIAFGVVAVALLAFGLVQGDFFSDESYITGFAVQEIADDGETFTVSGGDDESLSVSRKEVGSDNYFKVKKAVSEGVFVRASVYRGEIWELEADGDSLIRPDEDAPVDKHLLQARRMINLSVFLIFISAAFALSARLIRKSRRASKHASKRKNKK